MIDTPVRFLNAAVLCDDRHTGAVPLEAFKVVLLRSDNGWIDGDHQVFA